MDLGFKDNANAHIRTNEEQNKHTSISFFPLFLKKRKWIMVGYNNGVGWSMKENLVTFRDYALPDFLLAQKMRLKKCSSSEQ